MGSSVHGLGQGLGTMRSLPVLALAAAGCWTGTTDARGTAPVARGTAPVAHNTELESEIAAQLTKDHAVVDAVHCPRVAPRVGATVSCTVVIGGTPYERVVTIERVDRTGVDASSRWRRGEAVLSSRLSSMARDQASAVVGAPATIDCGEPVRFLAPDRTLRCDLTTGTMTTGVVFTLGLNSELTRLRLDPPMLLKPRLEELLAGAIRRTRGVEVTITCGRERLIEPPSDGIVWCDASGLAQGRVSVEVEQAPDGKLTLKRWQLLP